MKVGLTGASGFLGRVLYNKLLDGGHKIYNLSIEGEKDSIEFDFLKDYPLNYLDNKLSDMDCFYHLGAFVPKSVNDDEKYSLEIYKVNLLGTINLLRHLKNRAKKIVFASTIEVYGKNRNSPFHENSPTVPATNYGISKLLAEEFIRAWSEKHDLQVVILRFASIYGEGEIYSRAIPDFIQSALKNEDIVLYGDGSEKRNFIYVEDAAELLFQIMNKKAGGVFNIASGEICSKKELAEIIIELSRSKSRMVLTNADYSPKHLVLDTSKMRKNLNFSTRINMKTGLKREIDWFSARSACRTILSVTNGVEVH
jgi:UDP-glucose 4-epimerase